MEGAMGATRTDIRQLADIAFMVVLNGSKYAPMLVQRRSFNSRVGKSTARKTYQIAYAPKDFPPATRVVAGDPL
jgi:hypothetical protein